MTADELRELLTLAAKAAGLTADTQGRDDATIMACGLWLDREHASAANEWHRDWRPHLDDGDGARLEAALELDVVWYGHYVQVRHMRAWGHMHAPGNATFKDHGNDKQAARRMATLRAAAAIGRSMP